MQSGTWAACCSSETGIVTVTQSFVEKLGTANTFSTIQRPVDLCSLVYYTTVLHHSTVL